MTVAALSASISYVENGATLSFAVPFRFLIGALTVTRVLANGSVATLTLGVDYSVSGGTTDAGGTVTLVGSVAGATLRIRRATARNQAMNYATGDTFPAESHEAALDRAMMIDQEQDATAAANAARAVMVPDGETAPQLPSVENRKNKFLAFTALGAAFMSAGTGADAGLREDLANSSLGATLVGWIRAATGAVVKTVTVKLGFRLDAEDFAPNGWVPATDDATTWIQQAINEAASSRRTLYYPPIVKHGAVTLSNNASILGPASKSQVTAIAGSYSTLTIAGSDCVIQNLTVLEAAKSAGATFTIACGATGKERNTIENVITFNSWKLIDDSGTGNGVHTTTKLRSIQAKAQRGPGLAWTRGFAFLEWDHVIIDYVGVSASDFTAFSISGAGLPAGAGGLIVERCDVLGTMGVFNNPNQIAYDFSDLSAVRIRNSRADTCGSDGWRFTRINGLIAEDIASGLNNGHGMIFTSCISVIMTRVFLFGRNYLTSPAANKDGIKFVSGNAGIVMGTILTRDFTGHGVHKEAAQTGAINLANCSMFSNTGRGVKTVGNSGFILLGGQWAGNVAGNYDIGGGFDYVSGQLASGAFSTSIGPGPVTG